MDTIFDNAYWESALERRRSRSVHTARQLFQLIPDDQEGDGWELGSHASQWFAEPSDVVQVTPFELFEVQTRDDSGCWVRTRVQLT